MISKILGLFFDPFFADNKYSLLKRGNLLQHFQMQLSQKRKLFSNFFLHFLNLEPISNIFKNDVTHTADVILTLCKKWIDKCLRSPVSDYPGKSNMVNGPKHCSKLNDSTFTIFIDPCEGHSV